MAKRQNTGLEVLSSFQRNMQLAQDLQKKHDEEIVVGEEEKPQTVKLVKSRMETKKKK